MENNKDNEKLLLDRISDVKKSNELFDKSQKVHNNIIIPRSRREKNVPNKEEPKLIKPILEQAPTPIAAPTPKPKPIKVEEFIKPRKKSLQNPTIVNVDKDELKKTFDEMKSDVQEIDRVTKKEEKSLRKVLKMVEKKKDRLEARAQRLIEKERFEEATETLEIKDNYMAAMHHINKHLEKINTNYGPDISLKDRRKQIYQNSKLASTERARILMSLRELESKGVKLTKGNSDNMDRKSFYHRQLENQSNLDYMQNRNPYFKRLKEINDRGGITVAEGTAPQDRVADKWNSNKNNYDKNGRLKVKGQFEFPEEDE